MRIALVNDVGMAVEVLRRVVQSIPDAEVAWVATDGREAVAQCARDTPDLILMDLIMPVMDGVAATRLIMERSPCPILVVTATVTGNAAPVYEALGHGAIDAVNTPVLGTDGSLTGAGELIQKIRTVEKLTCPVLVAPPSVGRAVNGAAAGMLRGMPPMVAIGASTGGPQALVTVLSALPRRRAFAVIIVQHLDALFAPGLTQWLSCETKLPVRVIESGQAVEPGAIAVASTSDHLILDGCGRLRYVREPVDHVHRPSVDVFFHSLLVTAIRPGIAVLLTGMGCDGAAGLKLLCDAGWETIVQDEATSVVWGMPRAAVQLGAAAHVLPIDAIGQQIRRRFSGTLRANKEASP